MAVPLMLLMLSLVPLTTLGLPGSAVAQSERLTLPTVSETIFPGSSSPMPGNVAPSQAAAPYPFSIAVDTSNGLVYAPAQGTQGLQQLVVVNGSYASWVDDAHAPFNNTYPHQSSYGAFDPANGYLYVAEYGSGAISVYNGADGHLVTTIPLSSWVYGVLFLQSTGTLYAAVSGNDPSVETGVYAINSTTNSVIAHMSVGRDPQGMAYDPALDRLFVANYGTWMGPNGSISVISTLDNSVITTIELPPEPYYTYVQNVFFASDGYLYALGFNFWGGQHAAGSLYKIDPADGTLLATFPSAIADSNSGQMAQDPLGRLYVTSGNFIQVFDPTTGAFLGNITAGLETTGIAYDPFTADMLATNLVSGTISVIPTGASPVKVQPVTVTESGLPSGEHWGAGAGTLQQSTNETQIHFVLPSGSYRFSTQAPSGYAAPSFNLTVADRGVSVGVSFLLNGGPTTTTSTAQSSHTETSSSASTSSAGAQAPPSGGAVLVYSAAGGGAALLVISAYLLRRRHLLVSDATLP